MALDAESVAHKLQHSIGFRRDLREVPGNQRFLRCEQSRLQLFAGDRSGVAVQNRYSEGRIDSLWLTVVRAGVPRGAPREAWDVVEVGEVAP